MVLKWQVLQNAWINPSIDMPVKPQSTCHQTPQENSPKLSDNQVKSFWSWLDDISHSEVAYIFNSSNISKTLGEYTCTSNYSNFKNNVQGSQSQPIDYANKPAHCKNLYIPVSRHLGKHYLNRLIWWIQNGPQPLFPFYVKTDIIYMRFQNVRHRLIVGLMWMQTLSILSDSQICMKLLFEGIILKISLFPRFEGAMSPTDRIIACISENKLWMSQNKLQRNDEYLIVTSPSHLSQLPMSTKPDTPTLKVFF